MNQKETSHIHISSKEHLKRFNINLSSLLFLLDETIAPPSAMGYHLY